MVTGESRRPRWGLPGIEAEAERAGHRDSLRHDIHSSVRATCVRLLEFQAEALPRGWYGWVLEGLEGLEGQIREVQGGRCRCEPLQSRTHCAANHI